MNEYQEYFLGCKKRPVLRAGNPNKTTADFLEIWKPQPLETLRASPDLNKNCFTFTFSS
jgi:hypothetical protein